MKKKIWCAVEDRKEQNKTSEKKLKILMRNKEMWQCARATQVWDVKEPLKNKQFDEDDEYGVRRFE